MIIKRSEHSRVPEKFVVGAGLLLAIGGVALAAKGVAGFTSNEAVSFWALAGCSAVSCPTETGLSKEISTDAIEAAGGVGLLVGGGLMLSETIKLQLLNRELRHLTEELQGDIGDD